jgi:hypothetical protein
MKGLLIGLLCSIAMLLLFSLLTETFCCRDIKKRKGALKEAKAKKPKLSKKAAKAAKDPNAPKRPATAFFLFL